MEGGLRAAGYRGGVSCHDVDVLAAAAGGLGSAEPDLRGGQGRGGRRPGCWRVRRGGRWTPPSLDDAVATQDTVTQLIAAIRRVRREVAGAAEVIAEHCRAHDYDDPGKPAIAWDDAEARERLVDALVSDAHRLLGHLPEQELGPRAAEAVALLALVAGQDVEPVEGSDGTDGRWRIAQRVAPDRVISTVDPDARHAHKTVSRRQDGFKAHVAVEPDTGIITDCALTKASGADSHEAVVGAAVAGQRSRAGDGAGRFGLRHRGFPRRPGRAPATSTGSSRGPLPRRLPGGFTIDDFVLDHDAGTATCPNGLIRTITRTGNAVFGAACRGCPLRARCTEAARASPAICTPRGAAARRPPAAPRPAC